MGMVQIFAGADASIWPVVSGPARLGNGSYGLTVVGWIKQSESTGKLGPKKVVAFSVM